MSTNEFIERCKVSIITEELNNNKITTKDDIELVWYSKTLKNKKALFIDLKNLNDHKYYEATYNGDKNQIYLDVYIKEKNIEINIKNLED